MLDWLLGSSNDAPKIEGIIKELEKTRVERALALQEAMVERKNAYRLAMAKERFSWIASTGALTSILSMVASIHHRNIMYCLPVIPISMYIAHQAHLAYGNKMQITFDIAEKIILDSDAKLSTRPISIREIEARVLEQKESALKETSMGTAQSRATSITDVSETMKVEIERQIALRNLQFERELAIKKAKLKDSFAWEFLGCSSTIIAIVVQAHRTKNRFYAVPIVPLVMYLGYRYNETFGTLNEEICEEAEKIFRTKRQLITPIGGPITLEELDRRRNQWHHSNN